MIKKYIFIALAISVLAACNNKSKGAGKVALKTQKDSFAYGFGVTFGKVLKSSNIKEVDWEIFKTAAEYVFKNGDSSAQMNSETIDKVLSAYMTESKYGENKKKGVDYIAKKAKENGFIKTKSGLLFKEITKGTLEKPTLTDTVLVNFTGKLVNGETFDSNEGKEPKKYNLNGGAIPGLLEILNMMTVGSKYEVVIPFNLAYGERGMQRQNPYTGEPMMLMEPYQTLIYTLEIVGIKK